MDQMEHHQSIAFLCTRSMKNLNEKKGKKYLDIFLRFQGLILYLVFGFSIFLLFNWVYLKQNNWKKCPGMKKLEKTKCTDFLWGEFIRQSTAYYTESSKKVSCLTLTLLNAAIPVPLPCHAPFYPNLLFYPMLFKYMIKYKHLDWHFPLTHLQSPLHHKLGQSAQESSW